MMADSGCVSKAARGDEQAFAELVRRYRDAVYGLCYHRVGQAEEAKDLAQEAFLRAYLDLPQLRDPEAFPAWLRRVTDRVCRTWLRRRRLEVVSLAQVAEPAAESDLSLPVAVQQALDQLSEPARLAVTLCYIDGYSVGEVARFLEVPVGTVKSRLHHARRRLRGELMSEFRDALREGAPGDEFTGAVVRAVRSLEEGRKLPAAEYFQPESARDLKRYLVLEKDGTVLGVSFHGTDDIPIRGVIVHAARNAVTSGENDWHKGGLEIYDRLVPAALANLAELGYPIAVTHEEMMSAPRHGYVPCFSHYLITCPAGNLARGETRGTVRAYRKSDGPAVERLRSLPRARPQMWAWMGPEEEPPFVLARNGAVAGCLCLAEGHRTIPPALVNEMEALDMDGYRALAKHVAQEALRKGADTVMTWFSPHHPLGALMLQRGGVAKRQGVSWNVAKHEECVCILDLANALRAIAPGLGRGAKGRVSISMDGSVVTITAGDPPTISEGAKGPVSCIGRVSMTQLLVGYASAFEISGRPDVAIRNDDAALLDALFPKTDPYSAPDPYIWDEGNLLEDKPFITEELWRSKLAAHPRPWAV